MHQTTHPRGSHPTSCRSRRPAREDYEYERNGVAAIFCAFAPHLGWRHVQERERKTRCDYAAFLRALADEHFPAAERIVLVQDNLNTHSPASLYEAFPPAEAARIKARFEFHFTPPTRELDEHRRNRIERAEPWLSRPPHPRSLLARRRTACLAA